MPVGWKSVCLGFIALRPYIAIDIDSPWFNSGFCTFIKNENIGKIYSQVDGGLYARMMPQSNVPYCLSIRA